MSSAVNNVYQRLISFFYPVTLERTSSAYARDIRVILSRGKPSLFIDGAQQSGPKLHHIWKRVFRHFRISRADLAGSKALVLGIGGGDVVRIIRQYFPTVLIDMVDVDATVILLSRRYFGLSGISDVQVVNTDAGAFIKSAAKAGKSYGLIISDIYSGFDVPEKYTYEQSLKAVSAILTPTGRLILNFSPSRNLSGESDLMLDKLRKFYQSVERYGIFSYRFFQASEVKY